MRQSVVLFALFIGLLRASGEAAAQPPTGPVEVDVTPATEQEVIEYREFTGRTSAVNTIDIRARVSGYLLSSPLSRLEDEFQAEVAGPETSDKSQASTESAAARSDGNRTNAAEVVTVRQGDLVNIGDLLFLIDPQPYQLALQQARGSLQAAEARMEQARQTLERSRALLQRDATSRAEYDQSVAAVAELTGQIENLKATVARSQLDLEYTRVRAPMDGLLGRTLVTNGNLVVADSTILTTIVSRAPIYVDFDVDEQSVLDYRRRMLQGEVKSAREARIAIRLGLANEEGYPHEGYIDFVANTTDPLTGNTAVRGVFSNDQGYLSPGLFARIQVPFTGRYQAVVIPAPAIGMDQQGRFVYIVDEENTIRRRQVVVGSTTEQQVVIQRGLSSGERVVTSGLQRVRPGMQVSVRQPVQGSTSEVES